MPEILEHAMSRMNKSAEGIRKFGPYLQMVENGYTPQQIKEMCRSIISQYLLNPENLNRTLPEALYREAVNIGRINEDEWAQPRKGVRAL